MNNIKMGLYQFVKEISDSFKQDDLTNDTMRKFATLKGPISSMYVTDLALNFDGDLGTALQKQLSRELKKPSLNCWLTIKGVINSITRNEEQIIDSIADNLSTNIVKERLDFHSVNLLKYLDVLNFFNRYAAKAAPALLMEQMDESYIKEVSKPIDRADLIFLEENMVTFGRACALLAMPYDEFLKSLKRLKGHNFSLGAYDQEVAINGNKLDPNRMGFIPVSLNPIYHIGKLYNVYATKREDAMQAQRDKFELLVLEFKAEDSAKGNQSNAKAIKYYSNQLAKLEAKLADIAEE